MITEENKINRLNLLGGSDAAAICGKSSYNSKIKIYDRIVNKHLDRDQTISQEIGNILEPFIIKKYEQKTGRKINVYNGTLVHPVYDFVGGHIDGFVNAENVIFEAKTARNSIGFGEEGSSDVPQDYLCQAYHYLNLVDAKGVKIYVFFKDSESFKEYYIEHDKTVCDAILELEREFWVEHILAKNPPEPEDIDDVKIIFPRDNGKSINVNSEIEVCLNDLKQIRTILKDLTAKESGYKKQIMMYMQDNSILLKDNKPCVTWNGYKSLGLDEDALKAAHPEIYNQFLVEKYSRRLLIK